MSVSAIARKGERSDEKGLTWRTGYHRTGCALLHSHAVVERVSRASCKAGHAIPSVHQSLC